MPYNLDLEQRLDNLIVELGNFNKKKMFGGVCYLMNGNMVFGIHKQALIIRTEPERAEELLKKEGVMPFNITGRPMKGWLLIFPQGLGTEKQLLSMVNISIEFVRTLPKK